MQNRPISLCTKIKDLGCDELAFGLVGLMRISTDGIGAAKSPHGDGEATTLPPPISEDVARDEQPCGVGSVVRRLPGWICPVVPVPRAKPIPTVHQQRVQ